MVSAMMVGPSVAHAASPTKSDSLYGFDISYSLAPPDELLSGGPPKDGIPALTDPEVVPAGEADYLEPADRVVGVTFGGESRAYPIRILDWHENVNDMVGGRPIAVTFCPLCQSALVFDRRAGGEAREFGISGLLWNSNVVLYDRHDDPSKESLWSQVKMRAIAGPAAKQRLRLELLPSELTTWKEWVRKHPDTTALSEDTGYRRNYDVTPYRLYLRHDRIVFPVRMQKPKPERFRNKEPMVVVKAEDQWKAYAVKDVAAAAGDTGWMEDQVGGQTVRLTHSRQNDTVQASVVNAQGNAKEVPVGYMFWFALSAMLPEVEVYEPPS